MRKVFYLKAASVRCYRSILGCRAKIGWDASIGRLSFCVIPYMLALTAFDGKIDANSVVGGVLEYRSIPFMTFFSMIHPVSLDLSSIGQYEKR